LIHLISKKIWNTKQPLTDSRSSGGVREWGVLSLDIEDCLLPPFSSSSSEELSTSWILILCRSFCCSLRQVNCAFFSCCSTNQQEISSQQRYNNYSNNCSVIWGHRMSFIEGDRRETAFLFQRLSTCVQCNNVIAYKHWRQVLTLQTNLLLLIAISLSPNGILDASRKK